MADAHPLKWAGIQQNMAITLSDLATVDGEDRCGRLRQAIAHRKAALVVYTPDSHPQDNANTLSDLQHDRAAYASAGCATERSFDDIEAAH